MLSSDVSFTSIRPLLSLIGKSAAVAVCLSALQFADGKMVDADIVTYSDRAAWEAAVSGITTIDFNAITTDFFIEPDAPYNGGPFNAGPFTVTETGTQAVGTRIDALPFLSTVDIDGSTYLFSSLQGGVDPFTRETRLTYDNPISAWGTDVRSRFGGEQVRYDFVGAGQVSDPVGTSATFFGMVSTVGFSEIRMTSSFASSFGFDNISSGQFSSVPEPSALGMFGLAFALGGIRRRSRNQV